MKNRTFSYFLNWILLGAIAGFFILIFQGHIQLNINHSEKTSNGSSNHNLSYSDAVTRAAPSVVYIKALTHIKKPINNRAILLNRFLGKQTPLLQKVETITSSGSGVIIDSDGYILTNHHVIKNADEIIIGLYDGQQLPAKMIGTDIETDLAVLKISSKNLPKIKIAREMSSKIGDIVLAIGYPYEIGQTVTQGIISATGRTQVSSYIVENFIQTDAAINPGNSGGALINAEGEIIGINSLIYTKTGGFQGISFAIPIEIARDVLEQIKTNGHVARGWVGISGVEVSALIDKTTSVTGIYINEIDKEGPADLAGLQLKDVITHINGKAVNGVLDFIKVAAKGKPGETLSLSGIRRQQSFMTTIVLGKRPMSTSSNQ